MNLSPIEMDLVSALQQDARASNRALAKQVGIAESTCLGKLRDLQERGVIRGFFADVSLAAIDREVQAIISVQLRPKSRIAVESFRDVVATLDEVLGLFVVAGSDDFLVHVAVADTAALESFVLDAIAEQPNVADVRTAIVYEHHQQQPRPLVRRSDGG